MGRTKVSTSPCVHEPRPGETGSWDDTGLVEAAFGGPIPLHVPGAAGQIATVRHVEATPDDAESPALRSRMIRALGFLAVILGVLLLVDLLRP